jgi:hypothetical protein
LGTITSSPKKDTFGAPNDSKVSDHERSAGLAIQRNQIVRKHIEDVPENFSNYLEKLHLGKDRNLIVLSTNHYYYEAEDLKRVRILVNLKQLNNIKQVGDFLTSICSVLPEKSYFIGCFIDNKKHNKIFSDSHKPRSKNEDQFDPEENGISSRIPFLNLIYSFIDFKFNRYLTKTTVNSHLKEAALILRDVTEIEELTYFCAQKVLPQN